MPEITLIPKKQQFELKFSLRDAFFYIPIMFLVLVSLIFFGFFVYNLILQRSVSSVNEEIALVEGQRDLQADNQFINDIFNLNNRIQSLKGILDNHLYPSNFFSFFEKITLPKTTFSGLSVSFSGSSPNGTVSTRGETDGYIGLVKQIIIFSKSPDIKDARIAGISLASSGKVVFGLEMTFDKKILFEKKD